MYLLTRRSRGNQLAVSEDGPALSDDQMQRLARAMNHSGQLPAMGITFSAHPSAL